LTVDAFQCNSRVVTCDADQTDAPDAPDAPVYRGMTATVLCDEYQPAIHVPTAQHDIEGYGIRGEAARRAVEHQRLAYGSHPDEWLWYVPASQPDAPLLIFIHGGYWRRLSADDGCLLSVAAHTHGLAFASINHTLCPAAGLDDLVDQARRAVGFLIDQSLRLGHSPGAVHVSGHSAGAHLAAMVAVHDPRPAGYVYLSGVFDVEPVVWTPINDDVRLTVDDARRLSPMFLAPFAPAARQIVAVGSLESAEFHRQSSDWAERWEFGHGAAPIFIDVEGRHHFDVMDDLFDPATALGAAVLAQLG
jgi:arylformamidase